MQVTNYEAFFDARLENQEYTLIKVVYKNIA